MTLRTLALLGMVLVAVALPATLAVAEDDPHGATEEVHGAADEAPAHATSDEHAATPEGEHAETAHSEEAGHGGGHGEEEKGAAIELPNVVMLLFGFNVVDKHSPAGHWLHVFENALFSMVIGIFLCVVSIVVYRRRQDMPGRLQAFMEMVVETVESMVTVVLGGHARQYTPFIGTIFVYLLFMNYFGMVPLGKAATSTFLNNISIAICVFLYVQYIGLRKNGLLGYLHHLAGSPRDLTGWLLSPLMFFLEVFGEFVKPFSLSLRLFGNIFGEDLLLAVFALLGVILVSLTGIPPVIGLPLHLPFMFLSLLLGFIQAMVFAMLTTAYIGLMLPHEEHH